MEVLFATNTYFNVDTIRTDGCDPFAATGAKGKPAGRNPGF